MGQADIIISVSLGICDTTSEKLVLVTFKRNVTGKRMNKEKETMFVCMSGFDIIGIFSVWINL